MPILPILGVLVISYLVGSIPFGWIIVKLFTGRDVRRIESGRTGGTNVMRAAGVIAGLLTALLDIAKGASTHFIVGWLMPAGDPWFVWMEVAAPLMAIIGHNYSIYLLEPGSDGKVMLRGGAGGATCLGGSIGLWWGSGPVILLIGVFVFLVVGYASVTTMSIAVSSTIAFAYLTIVYGAPWQYILYGILAFIAVAWALRPNLERLRNGTERPVGLRAARLKRMNQNPRS